MKGDQDLCAAQVLADNRDIADAIVGFHCPHASVGRQKLSTNLPV
jgi:hypothetical protein